MSGPVIDGQSLASVVISSVSENERKELAEASEQHKLLYESVGLARISGEGDFTLVTDSLKEIKRLMKELEERKQRVTRPLMAALEEVRSWFRPAQTWLEKTEKVLKAELARYQQEVEQRNIQAMKLLAETKGQAAVQFESRPSEKGLSITSQWDFEVLEPSLVPRDFLTVDHNRVKAHIKATQKGEKPADIPGIRFVEKARVAVRT